MDNWYLQKGEQRLGPMTLESLKAMVAAGQVAPNDLVWTTGMASWLPANSQSWYFSEPTRSPSSISTPYGAQPSYQPAMTLGAPQPFGTEPPSLIGWSIAVLLCCCLPGGIVGIVYGNKSKNLWAQGNYEASQAAYRTGKGWLIGSAIAGVVINLVYLLIKMSNHL